MARAFAAWALVVLLGLLVAAPVAQGDCRGDCDGDGTVTVGELIKGVTIALGTAMVASCPAVDSSGDGSVTVDELIAAVHAALIGCMVATPTVEATPSPTPGPEADVFEGVTGADGKVTIRDGDGVALFETEVFDPTGQPLGGIRVLYLGSVPDPVAVFMDAGSGAPAGTFLLGPPAPVTAGAHRAGAGEENRLRQAVMILSLLDPIKGHIYNAARDNGSPTINTNIEWVRELVGLAAITQVLDSTPGLTDEGVLTKESILHKIIFGDEFFAPANLAHLTQHFGAINFLLFSQNQHSDYRYRVYHSVHPEGLDFRLGFLLPLGVKADVTIDSPEAGTTSANEVVVSGTVTAAATVISTAGGRLELRANGEDLSDTLALQDLGDGSTYFESDPLLFAEGDNVIEVRSYVNEVNRGLEGGEDGLYDTATVTVTYTPPQPPRLKLAVSELDGTFLIDEINHGQSTREMSFGFAVHALRSVSFSGNTFSGSWDYESGPTRFTGSVSATFSDSMDRLLSISIAENATYGPTMSEEYAFGGSGIPLQPGSDPPEYRATGAAACSHIASIHRYSETALWNRTLVSFSCNESSGVSVILQGVDP